MSATVLIVDDDEPTQKLLDALMRRHGLATLTAHNGSSAIAVLEERDDIACIILDLMMPEVGGPAVVDYLKAAGREVPVIVCTAAVQRSMPVFDRSIVRAMFPKPFDIDQLSQTVLQVIG